MWKLRSTSFFDSFILLPSFSFIIILFNSAICSHLISKIPQLLHLHKFWCTLPQLVNVVIIWCIATSGLKLRILNATFPKRCINNMSDSPFSCLIFTKAIEVKWCGWLVANCTPNFSTSVSKQSMDNSGKRVNQLKVAPFKVVGNT